MQLPLEEKSRLFIFFSALLHILFLLILIVNLTWESPTPVLENSENIINASVLMSRPPPMAPIKPVKEPVLAPEPKVVEPNPIIKKVEVKKEVPKPIIKKAIAIPEKKTKPKLLKKEVLEKQLLSDFAKEIQPKKFKDKAIAKEFAKEMRELNAKSLQQQMLTEVKNISNARNQQMQGVVDKYKALILQAIGQHWVVPPTIDKRLFAELLIRLAPGGVVLDVQLVKSSGDPTLDRSAKTAVFKSSPLPVPEDSQGFDQFRQFVLRVKPENILAQD
jgi:colicin import membrane protein